jgi:hypothetical protein
MPVLNGREATKEIRRLEQVSFHEMQMQTAIDIDTSCSSNHIVNHDIPNVNSAPQEPRSQNGMTPINVNSRDGLTPASSVLCHASAPATLNRPHVPIICMSAW